MRKIWIIFLISLLHAGCSPIMYNQAVILDTSCVPIYEYRSGKKISETVDNTRSHEEEDWYYETVILNKSRSRFLVLSQLFEGSDILQKSFWGWVDKKYCIVFPGCDKYIDGKPLLYLYSGPNTNNIKDSLVFNSFLDMKMYNVTNIRKNTSRIKVEIDYYGNKYIGWTGRFCSNVYNSCN